MRFIISSASSGSGTASAAAASGGSTELRYRPRSYYEEYGCRRGYGGCGYNGYGGNALYGFDNYYPFDSGYGGGYGRGGYGGGYGQDYGRGYEHGGYLRDDYGHGEYGHGEYKQNKYGEVRNGVDLGYGGYGKYSDRRGYGGHGGYGHGDRHYGGRYNDVFQDRYFYPFPVYDYSFDRYYYDKRLGSFRDHYYPFGYAYGNGFRHGYQ